MSACITLKLSWNFYAKGNKLGRPAKPDSIHELHGTKSRASKAAVKPTALDQITEEPPGHLPVSAGVAYRETASALNTLGIGSQADTGLIESYAMALGLFRDASAQIAAEGLVIEDRDGNVRKHPLLATVNQTSTQIKNLGSRLGLDPVTRAGLEIERPPAGGGDSLADKWGHYLND